MKAVVCVWKQATQFDIVFVIVIVIVSVSVLVIIVTIDWQGFKILMNAAVCVWKQATQQSTRPNSSVKRKKAMTGIP